MENGGRMADLPTVTLQLLSGEKSIMHSLYGDGRDAGVSYIETRSYGVLEERPLAGHGRSRSTVGC
jgi:hypothetical protein